MGLRVDGVSRRPRGGSGGAAEKALLPQAHGARMEKAVGIAGGALAAAAILIAASLALAPPAGVGAQDGMAAPAPATVPAPAPAGGGMQGQGVAGTPEGPSEAYAEAVSTGAGGAAAAVAAEAAPGSGRDEGISGALPLTEIFEMVEEGTVRVEVRRPPSMLSPVSGVGSGIVFDSRGNIVTNAHVVDGADRIFVTFLDGRSYNAEVVGADPFTDIAVIRAPEAAGEGGSRLHPLRLGDSANLMVGEPIAAIGNPFGLSGSMTSGIVSQLGRLLPAHGAFQIPDIIQTDAAINPGNSGGPLLNMRGEVVGINTAIRSDTGEFTGVGFAVPSQTVAKIVPVLIRDGGYRHPWIGVSGMDIDPDTAGALGLDDTRGFLVMTVVEGSPADRAGLRGSSGTVLVEGPGGEEEERPAGGDIITGVDGIEVRRISDILVHLQRAKTVGDDLALDILRDGRSTSLVVVLGERPESVQIVPE